MFRRLLRSKSRAIGSTLESLEVRAMLATITVTSLADNMDVDGSVTLREAIEAANSDVSVDGSVAGSGADTIEFAIAGTIVVGSRLDITENLTIAGQGAGVTVIDGYRGTRLFEVFRKLSDVRFEDLTMTNAISAVGGSSVNVQEKTTVRLERVEITKSRSYYGAVYGEEARIEVNDSRFSDNRAYGPIEGTAANSARGGAIYAYRDSDLVVSDSEFVNNRADFAGGAIYFQGRSRSNRPQREFILTNSVFRENQGGAIHGAYFARIEATGLTVEGTEGAGISVFGGSLSSSYIAGNTGVGVYDGFVADPLLVANTTIVHNGGGGVSGAAHVINSTIAYNTGGGVFSSGTLVSSIVAWNTLDGEHLDLRHTGAPTLQNSIVGSYDGNAFDPTGDTPDADGNLIGTLLDPIDPGFLPLGTYGTSTHFLPLHSNSPALNRGANPEGFAVDQIGGPRVVGPAPDMGAVEGAFADGVISVTNFGVQEGDSGGASLVFTLALEGATTAPFTVDVRTEDGTGTVADNDYIPVDETVSFSGSAGETRTVTVSVVGDSHEELDETLTLLLSDVTNSDVVIRDVRTETTISNDDLTVGMNLQHGILIVRGGSSADEIELSDVNGQIQVDFNGSRQQYARESVSSFRIFGGEGGDLIQLKNVDIPALIEGDEGDDTVKGGIGADTIDGGPGNDKLRGTKGHDEIRGGLGDDVLRGQVGFDVLYGEEGQDTLQGGEDDDYLFGGPGSDSLHGHGGRDVIYAETRESSGSESETIKGGAAQDLIFSGDAADVIKGGSGNDRVDAGGGDDNVNGGSGADTLYGRDGHDRIEGSSGNDTIQGELGRDTLIGQDGDDLLGGGLWEKRGEDEDEYYVDVDVDGHDVLKGGEGNDYVTGGVGRDSLFGGSGDDTVLGGGTDDDRIIGGPGVDGLYGGGGADFIDAGEGDDSVVGGNGADTILGRAGNDLLMGRNGDDLISGGADRDVLIGGLGSDTLRGDSGGDFLVAFEAQGFRSTTVGGWAEPGKSYTKRAEAAIGSLTELAVDLDADVLEGHAERDLFYISMTAGQDTILDKQDDEDRELF